MDDQTTPSEPVDDATTPPPANSPEPVPTPVEPDSSQPTGSDTANMPPEAPESPISVPDPIPVESQNGGVNQLESEVPEASILEPVQVVAPASAPALQIPQAPQAQSPAQQDQTGFIRTLLAKANAKIQSKRQKKLELLMQAVSKKGKIDNREAQKLLRISDKTAERYLNKLVTQGRLKRSGAGRDVIYTPLR